MTLKKNIKQSLFEERISVHSLPSLSSLVSVRTERIKHDELSESIAYALCEKKFGAEYKVGTNR